MLTGLKVSPVTCKCVFYRPEHNIKGDIMELNFEVLQMQKWHIPMDKAEIVDKKNGVIFINLCFFSKLWSLKCQKWLIFCIFCWWQQKSVTVLAKYLSESKKSYLALLQKML